MNSSLNSVVNENLVPRTPLYQSSEAPAAGSGRQMVDLFRFYFYLTEVGGVDWIEDSSVDLEERVTRVYGELSDLLVVVGVGVVVVAVGPQPELGVGVEGVGEDGDRVQGLHEVPDVGHLWLAEGLGPTESLVAGVVTHTGLSPVEVPVPVGINSVAAALGGPGLPP